MKVKSQVNMQKSLDDKEYVKKDKAASWWNSSVILIGVCLLCYCNSLGNELVFDDIPAIVENRDLRPDTSIFQLLQDDFWGTPLQKEESHKSYRPLCVLTFRLNYLFHQVSPFGYHLVNILLHAVVCVLYHRLCLEFLQETPSLISSLLFAVHPIHTEAVAGVVGRAELLSSAFFLLALLTYLRSTKSGSFTSGSTFLRYISLVALAMFSKEQGITVGGICIVFEVFLIKKTFKRNTSIQSPRSKIKGPTPTWRKDLILRLLMTSVGILILLLFRLKIMGTSVPVFNRLDNPASTSQSPTRQLTYNYLLSVNAWLLVDPSNLCCDWTMGTVPLLTSLGDGRNCWTLMFYFVLYVFVRKSFVSDGVHSKRIMMGLCLMCIPFVPASNLFFPVGFVVAERVLYIPSMGFCMLVAYGFHCLLLACGERRGPKFAMWSCLTILLCLNITKTIRRNSDWKNEETLFLSALQVTTQNAKIWNNLGHVMDSRGDHQKALELFLKATEIQPDDIGGHLNVGTAYTKLGKTEDAEKAFWKARDLLPKARQGRGRYAAYVAPRHLELFRHLGSLLSRNESRLEEAQQIYEEAITMKQDYTEAHLDRADILVKLNRSREARAAYSQALKHDSMNPDIFYNIGVLLLEEGDSEQALRHFDKALQLNPQHEKSLINYAILTQESGDSRLRKLARERLQFLLNKGNTPPERIYFNMGMLAMQDHEWSLAERYFKQAIQLKSNFTSALFNVALLLHNQNRHLEAVPYLRLLLQHHNYHLKGLMLLGNIYFAYVKDYHSAKECYEVILRHNNEYLPALHNLCAVYVQLDKLDDAEQCLTRASQKAPEELDLLEHLRMVRQKKDSSSNDSNNNSYHCGDDCESPLDFTNSKKYDNDV